MNSIHFCEAEENNLSLSSVEEKITDQASNEVNSFPVSASSETTEKLVATVKPIPHCTEETSLNEATNLSAEPVSLTSKSRDEHIGEAQLKL